MTKLLTLFAKTFDSVSDLNVFPIEWEGGVLHTRRHLEQHQREGFVPY